MGVEKVQVMFSDCLRIGVRRWVVIYAASIVPFLSRALLDASACVRGAMNL